MTSTSVSHRLYIKRMDAVGRVCGVLEVLVDSYAQRPRKLAYLDVCPHGIHALDVKPVADACARHLLQRKSAAVNNAHIARTDA